MRNFRLLKADEIECRISTISEKGLSLLLYKTARTDYALLDETVGMYYWQNDYKVIDGKMYCGIGILINGGTKLDKDGISIQRNEWVWKWNCGVESNTEAEKGQASDAMKRAGFCWGIGTELYSAPFIWIPSDSCKIELGKNAKLVCYDKFYVRTIEYNEAQDISKLVIVNASGKMVFEHPHQNGVQNAPQRTEKAPANVEHPARKATPASAPDGEFQPMCKDCGEPIDVKVHDFSVKFYGAPYCRKCQKNHASR